MLLLSLSLCDILFSVSDSATWYLSVKVQIFSIFMEWEQAGPQQFLSQKQQIQQQQQPSCPPCGTYYQLWVNTGSWHLKMETNKPGILTKAGNNGAMVPALLLYSFQRLCAGMLEKKASQHFSKC